MMHLSSRSGLEFELNANGSIHRMRCAGTMLNLFLGSELEAGPANIYLRLRAQPLRIAPLLGPRAGTRFSADTGRGRLVGYGTWQDLRYRLTLTLSDTATAWFWHVWLQNDAGHAQEIDLIHVQDLALAPYAAVRLNEYYVSQYIDHAPLVHAAHGVALASRQNLPVEGRHPWCLLASLRRATSFATDALQVYGVGHRAGSTPAGLAQDLPGRRLQHEHSLVALQDEPLRLAPGERRVAGFCGLHVEDHPLASSAADLSLLERMRALPEARAVYGEADASAHGCGADHRLDSAAGEPSDFRADDQARDPRNLERPDVDRAGPARSLFAVAPTLDARDLDAAEIDALFGPGRRHEERDEHGRLLSFFVAQRHVVLRAKELRVLRPHGHLLRTGHALTPDETALTSTVWMNGVFHSLLTQGHVSINRFLSTVRGYLGLFHAQGLRVFVSVQGSWRLLDVPSAFDMARDHCRWIYRHAGGSICVRSDAGSDPHALGLEIEVDSGEPLRFMICLHVALDGDDGVSQSGVSWRVSETGIDVAPPAGSALARRFPQGSFSIDLLGGGFEHIANDEALFEDQCPRGQPWLCIVTKSTSRFELRIRGRLVTDGPDVPRPLAAVIGADTTACADGSVDAGPGGAAKHAASAAFATSQATLGANWRISAPVGSAYFAEVEQLADIAPWFEHDALIHYLSPRGLEQYSGGGWGTRDVTQGPVELLLTYGCREALRDLLLRVLRAQNPDGDWPQWFAFFERERSIRARDAHGDIVFWPLLALAQYLLATADAALLEEPVPFFDARGPQVEQRGSVWQHVQRALTLIERRIVPGTALAAYGHGDWNDALQPADPSLRERLCSAWTVTLHHQTLTALARALRLVGRSADAALLEQRARNVHRDFQRLLIVDGVLAGYALFDRGEVRLLLHPSDQMTGIRYSALAMIHAVLEGLFTPQQARDHLQLLESHLSGPDGVRLFDRPMAYHGGPQRLFQRAESAAYFGREIGLMYMHAHLRYAQALAHLGDADRFFRALCQANPIGIRTRVPSAAPRQANCYYSSSDAAFADRYEACAEYARVAAGTVALEGGWRVYSSGAGIAVALLVRRLLGLSFEAEHLCIDPVVPAALDGLRARAQLYGRDVEIVYRVRRRGCGVERVEVERAAMPLDYQDNPYRRGAARVPTPALLHRLVSSGCNRIAVFLE